MHCALNVRKKVQKTSVQSAKFLKKKQITFVCIAIKLENHLEIVSIVFVSVAGNNGILAISAKKKKRRKNAVGVIRVKWFIKEMTASIGYAEVVEI